MYTTKINNKEKRRQKIAREKEEKIKRRRNQEIEKERRKRTKKQRKQKTNDFGKIIAGCSPEELLTIPEEIKNDSCLTKRERKKLWIQILSKLSSLTNPDVLLVDNIINQIRKESLEELGEKEYREHIGWQISEAKQNNNLIIESKKETS